MLALLAETTVQAIPDLSVITPIVYLCLQGLILIIIISMFKGFITHGISIAVAEWLLKMSDNDSQHRVVRWFANGEKIEELLTEIRDRTTK